MSDPEPTLEKMEAPEGLRREVNLRIGIDASGGGRMIWLEWLGGEAGAGHSGSPG